MAAAFRWIGEVTDTWYGLALLREARDAEALDRLRRAVQGMVSGDRFLELPTAAVYLAEADIPIARGWYRQDDFPQNEVLYGHPGAHAYVAWLHRLGVRYVVLTHGPTDYSSRAEAKLLRSGRTSLRPVFRTRELTIFYVPGAQPIAPGLLALTESHIKVAVRHAGTERIAVRYSPYWHASDGCLSEGRDGMLRLANRRARIVSIVFAVNASRALGALAGRQPHDCKLG